MEEEVRGQEVKLPLITIGFKEAQLFAMGIEVRLAVGGKRKSDILSPDEERGINLYIYSNLSQKFSPEYLKAFYCSEVAQKTLETNPVLLTLLNDLPLAELLQDPRKSRTGGSRNKFLQRGGNILGMLRSIMAMGSVASATTAATMGSGAAAGAAAGFATGYSGANYGLGVFFHGIQTVAAQAAATGAAAAPILGAVGTAAGTATGAAAGAAAGSLTAAGLAAGNAAIQGLTAAAQAGFAAAGAAVGAAPLTVSALAGGVAVATVITAINTVSPAHAAAAQQAMTAAGVGGVAGIVYILNFLREAAIAGGNAIAIGTRWLAGQGVSAAGYMFDITSQALQPITDALNNAIAEQGRRLSGSGSGGVQGAASGIRGASAALTRYTGDATSAISSIIAIMVTLKTFGIIDVSLLSLCSTMFPYAVTAGTLFKLIMWVCPTIWTVISSVIGIGVGITGTTIGLGDSVVEFLNDYTFAMGLHIKANLAYEVSQNSGTIRARQITPVIPPQEIVGRMNNARTRLRAQGINPSIPQIMAEDPVLNSIYNGISLTPAQRAQIQAETQQGLRRLGHGRGAGAAAAAAATATAAPAMAAQVQIVAAGAAAAAPAAAAGAATAGASVIEEASAAAANAENIGLGEQVAAAADAADASGAGGAGAGTGGGRKSRRIKTRKNKKLRKHKKTHRR
jgi:hypothetical protein